MIPNFQPLPEFERQRKSYEEFCRKFEELVQDILKGGGVPAESTDHRVKSHDSTERKVLELEKDFATWGDFAATLGDLAGVRAIFCYRDEVERAADILRPEFNVHADQPYGFMDLEPERFGYVTWQFTVSLKDPRSASPEWAAHREKRVEIQLRTLLQHAWAEHSRRWHYKSPGLHDPRLERQLACLAALVEIGDRELCQLVEGFHQIRESYQAHMDAGEFDQVPLDADSLQLYLKNPDTLGSVVTVAKLASYDDEVQSRLGEQNKFIRYARECDIDTLADLRSLTENAASRIQDLVSIREAVVKRSLSRGPAALPLDVLIFLLILDRDEAASLLRRSREDFDDRIAEALFEVRGSLKVGVPSSSSTQA